MNKEKNRIYQAEYNKKNKETISEIRRKRYLKNRDSIKKKYQENKEKIREKYLVRKNEGCNLGPQYVQERSMINYEMDTTIKKTNLSKYIIVDLLKKYTHSEIRDGKIVDGKFLIKDSVYVDKRNVI